jgi:hypothetical protein
MIYAGAISLPDASIVLRLDHATQSASQQMPMIANDQKKNTTHHHTTLLINHYKEATKPKHLNSRVSGSMEKRHIISEVHTMTSDDITGKLEFEGQVPQKPVGGTPGRVRDHEMYRSIGPITYAHTFSPATYPAPNLTLQDRQILDLYIHKDRLAKDQPTPESETP